MFLKTLRGAAAGVAVGVVLSASLYAQPSWQQQSPAMKTVDPGVADMGPLATQGRVMPKDVRQPSQFDRVYEVEMNGQKFFARANGATIAVFPRSAYAFVGGTVIPIVPAGTKFFLGKLPDGARPVDTGQYAPPNSAARSPMLADSARPLGNWIDRSAAAGPERLDANMRSVGPVSEVSSTGVSLWENETYRISRLAELLDAARKARAGTRLGSAR